jgi:uncharacterized membrane protein (DUF485 family)
MARSSGPNIDWEAAVESAEFGELTRKKRSFVFPATAFFLTWYFGFIVLAGYAPGFMGESIYEGFTVGYLFALSQFVMVWVLAAWYIRKGDREFDPLAARVRESALGKPGRSSSGNGRSGNGEVAS